MENVAKMTDTSTVSVSESSMLWGFSSDFIEFSIAAMVVVVALIIHTLSANGKAQKKAQKKLGSCAGWVDNRGAGSCPAPLPNSLGIGKTPKQNKKSKQNAKQTNPKEIFIMSPGLLKKDGLDSDLPPDLPGSSASTVCGESSEDEAPEKNASDNESETEKGTPNLLDMLPMTPPQPLKTGPGPKPPGLAIPPLGLTAPPPPTKQAMPTSLSAGSQNLLALLREERAAKADEIKAKKVEEGVRAAPVPPWRKNRPKVEEEESKVPEWRCR